MTLKHYVVWWTYSANYAEPQSVVAETPEDAFNIAFGFYKNTHDEAFRKYAVEITADKKFHILE